MKKSKTFRLTHFTCAVCGERLKIKHASSCYLESRCIACQKIKEAEIDRAYAERRAAEADRLNAAA